MESLLCPLKPKMPTFLACWNCMFYSTNENPTDSSLVPQPEKLHIILIRQKGHLAAQLKSTIFTPVAFNMERFIHSHNPNALLLALVRHDSLRADGASRGEFAGNFLITSSFPHPELTHGNREHNRHYSPSLR